MCMDWVGMVSTSDLHLDRHVELDAELANDILLPLLDRMERTSTQQELLDTQLPPESEFERATSVRVWETRATNPNGTTFDLDVAQPTEASEPPDASPPVHLMKHSQGAQKAIQREHEQLHPNHIYFPPGPPPSTLQIPMTQLPQGLRSLSPYSSDQSPQVTLQLVRYHRALRTVWKLPTDQQDWNPLLVQETLISPGQRSPTTFSHVEWVPSRESGSLDVPPWSSVLSLVQPWLTMRYPTLDEAHLLAGSARLPSSSSSPRMP